MFCQILLILPIQNFKLRLHVYLFIMSLVIVIKGDTSTECSELSDKDIYTHQHQPLGSVLSCPQALQLSPNDSISPSVIFSLSQVDVFDPVVDSHAIQCAKRLTLPPEQEHMHLPITRSLVIKRSRSSKSRSKSGLLGCIFKRP